MGKKDKKVKQTKQVNSNQKISQITEGKLFKFMYFYIKYGNERSEKENFKNLVRLAHEALESCDTIEYSKLEKEKKLEICKLMINTISSWENNFAVLHKLITRYNVESFFVDGQALKQFRRAVERKEELFKKGANPDYDEEFRKAVYSFVCRSLGKPFTELKSTTRGNIANIAAASIKECENTVEEYQDLNKWLFNNYQTLIEVY